MQSHNRLFSYKQIVGISLFLSVVLVFSFTGFSFFTSISLPGLPTMPNPFKNYCDTVDPFKQPYCRVAQQPQDIIRYTTVTPELVRSQQTIESFPCQDLPNLYEANTGWDLRNYIAYRIVYECP